MSVWDLTRQARELTRWAAEYQGSYQHWRETFDVTPESVTVAQMTEWLCGNLSQAEWLPLNAVPLLETQPSAAHQSCLFLAMLELVRDQQCTIEQEASFGAVWLGCCARKNITSD